MADYGVLFAAGGLLIGLGLWGLRRGRPRSTYAGIGFVAGGLIAILVGLLAAAGILRE